MSTVRVGMFLPRSIMGGRPALLKPALARMEAAGVDHVGTADHVSFHSGWGLDGLINATAYLMANDALPVYVGVYLLALRHPVTVMRQLSAISEHAPGRLTLGIGIGGEDRHELEVCGVDPATRGRRTDECLAVLRGLMAGEAFSFDGRFYQLDRARITPAPPEPIPLIVGGRDPRALRRAGRLGDGWLGIWSTPESFAERVATVEAEAAAAGRTEVAWRHGLQSWCGFGRTQNEARGYVAEAMHGMYRLPFERFERYTPYGTPEDVASALRPFVAAGCKTFNISAPAASWEESIDSVGEVRRLLNQQPVQQPVPDSRMSGTRSRTGG